MVYRERKYKTYIRFSNTGIKTKGLSALNTCTHIIPSIFILNIIIPLRPQQL